jgi:RNA polymerase sigma-70 factor (ECF subfamily)
MHACSRPDSEGRDVVVTGDGVGWGWDDAEAAAQLLAAMTRETSVRRREITRPGEWSHAPGSLLLMAVPDPLRSPRPGAGAELDADSREWVRALSAPGGERELAAARLHELLLGVARAECYRRRGQLRISGPELDDLAHQAAADAVVAIIGKIGQFRGESRFTTWAYKFAIFEVSSKIGRHFWRRPPSALDTEDWERLPDRLGLSPAREYEWRDLLRALRDAVEQDLTQHQRQVFVALVLNQVPLDALVAERDSSRNAIYKTLFDARRKLRASLVARGYLDQQPAVRS